MCFFSPSREHPVLSNKEHFPKLLFKHAVSFLCTTDTFMLNVNSPILQYLLPNPDFSRTLPVWELRVSDGNPLFTCQSQHWCERGWCVTKTALLKEEALCIWGLEILMVFLRKRKES